MGVVMWSGWERGGLRRRIIMAKALAGMFGTRPKPIQESQMPDSAGRGPVSVPPVRPTPPAAPSAAPAGHLM